MFDPTQKKSAKELQTRARRLEVAERDQAHLVNAFLRGRRRFRMVIISQQTSDCIPCARKVLDIEVQVFDTLLRVPVGDLQLYISKMCPMRSFDVNVLSVILQTAGLVRLR